MIKILTCINLALFEESLSVILSTVSLYKMANPNINVKRKRHNYLVDYQIEPEDKTEKFVYFTDLLRKYENVDRPKDPFCSKTGDPKSLFLELHDRGFKYPELPKLSRSFRIVHKHSDTLI